MSETKAQESHRTSDSAGAIYGTIVAMATIAAGAHSANIDRLVLITFANLFIFWVAHVYAATLSHHLRASRWLDWGAIKLAMAEEWPLVTGPLPCMIVLALGSLDVLADKNAVRIALWIGVVQLLGWGISFARRRQWGWTASLISGAVNALCGLGIVALEVLIH